jgi:pyruvate kinase
MKKSKPYRRRTKIVCTIGPATSSAPMIERLLTSGMNVARLNLSHGLHSDHARYIQRIRKQSQRRGIHVGILLDLPGPKFRIGKLKGGQATLKKGAQVVLTTRHVEGDATLVPVTLPNLSPNVKVGSTALLDDGAMQLKVLGKEGDDVKCRVMIGGVLTEGRGLVIPGTRTSGTFVTDALREHLLFALRLQPDYLALSFVSSAENVEDVRAILREQDADIPIIVKIERSGAVKDFDTILEVSDGIMIARGDLGVDIPLEKVPLVQKELLQKCNRAGKPVITATQMLESMVKSARPTRAEVTDVANAIFDGSDAIMLSDETSIGKYPAQAVMMMSRIAQETEASLPYEHLLAEMGEGIEEKTDELISYNACHTAHVLGAAAIVAFTESGSTAGRVSKYRPKMPVLAITPSPVVLGRLLLRWGVHPLQIPPVSSTDELFATAVKISKEVGLARTGDFIVVTAGTPIGVIGSTNLLKVEKVP